MPENNPRPALPLTATGVPIAMQEHREGSATDFLSPNWCDRSTWISSSIRESDQVATDSGDGLTWNLPHSDLIDVRGGKITQEHRLHATHAIEVSVDGNPKIETCNTLGTNDFTVDHANGSITFAQSQAGKSVVVSYSRVVDSVWVVAPTPGKRLRLTAVEVQFSLDVELSGTVRFDFYGLVDVFAPHLLDTANPPGPYPSGTKIPLGSPRLYQTMIDFVNEAQRSFATIPQLGGTGWRATNHSIQIFRWPYAEDATRDLLSSAGMEVRISIQGDQPFVGSHAYATIYATSEDE